MAGARGKTEPEMERQAVAAEGRDAKGKWYGEGPGHAVSPGHRGTEANRAGQDRSSLLPSVRSILDSLTRCQGHYSWSSTGGCLTRACVLVSRLDKTTTLPLYDSEG